MLPISKMPLFKRSPALRAIFAVAAFVGFLAFAGAPFLLASSPTVVTEDATSIAKNSVFMRLTVPDDGNKAINSVGWEYGTSTSYGSTLTTDPFYFVQDLITSSGSAEGEMQAPEGVAQDSSGNVYVVDSFNNRIQKFDSSGSFVEMYGWGVATGANNFEVCTSSCLVGLSGSGDGEFSNPHGIAFDLSGNFYITDSGNDRVQKFDSSGGYLSKFGLNGSGNGDFSNPTGITIDSSGNIYIVDTGNNLVQKFNSSGVFQSQFGGAGGGNGTFSFTLWGGVAVNSTGDIFVADDGNNVIQKFNSSGVFQSQFGAPGSANGEFSFPNSLEIDEDDFLYVLDSGNSRIQKFDTTNNSFVAASTVPFSGHPNYTDFFLDDSKEIIVIAREDHDVFKISQTDIGSGVSGLSCGKDYHYRAFATNVDGTSYGVDKTFTTLACDTPVVETKTAVPVSKTSAYLNGLQTSDGVSGSTARGFEYGITTSYGQTANMSDSSLSVSQLFSDVGTTSSSGIATDSMGNIYVINIINNSVEVFDSSNNFIKTFGWGVSTGASQFEICISSCLAGLQGGGSGEFDFTSLGSIAINLSTGDIYVEDANGLQKFDSSGNFLVKIPGVTGAKDMLVIPGNTTYLYTSGVKKYALDGTLIATLNGSTNGAIALSTDGVIFSTDAAGDRIVYTSQSGGSSGVINFTYPSGFTPINNPSSISFDSKNNMIIGDFDSVAGVARLIFAVPISATDYAAISSFDANQIFSAGGGGIELTTTPSDSFISDNNKVYISSVNEGVLYLSPFFSVKIKPLTCATDYHYRAFATNADGTSYGNDVTFTTSNCSGGGGGGGSGPTPVLGCTDPSATNYNPLATQDNGSCNYPTGYFGCTDPSATNYLPGAQSDDGTCQYPGFGCMDPAANNYDPTAVNDDGSCTFDVIVPPVPGCMNNVATNYNPLATIDNGSCIIPGGGGPIEPPPPPPTITGCTDTFAQNYDSSATVEDGTCEYIAIVLPPWIPTPVTEVVNNFGGYIIHHPAILEGIKVAAVAGLVVPAAVYLLSDIADLVSIPVRLWNLIPTLLGFRRKRRPWGTVYDSVTKQPLDPVTVVLSDMMGAEISTSITDLDGRYGFWVPQGTYKIVANKGDYVFPSAKMAGRDHDELYDNLYFGGEIAVESEDDIINKNIPMDAINFNWNEFEKSENKKLMKFYSARDLFLARIAKILFVVGFVSSAVLAVIEPRMFNYVILGIYVVISILSVLGIKPRTAGHVVERETKMPLSFGIMRVYSAALGAEVNHTVIGSTGKYYLLVPKGRYYVKLFKKTGENDYKEVFTTETFKVRKGYIDKVIKI